MKRGRIFYISVAQIGWGGKREVGMGGEVGGWDGEKKDHLPDVHFTVVRERFSRGCQFG